MRRSLEILKTALFFRYLIGNNGSQLNPSDTEKEIDTPLLITSW